MRDRNKPLQNIEAKTPEQWNEFFDKIGATCNTRALRKYYDDMPSSHDARQASRVFSTCSLHDAPLLMQEIVRNDWAFAIVEGIFSFRRLDIVQLLLSPAYTSKLSNRGRFVRGSFDYIFYNGEYPAGVMYTPVHFGMKSVQGIFQQRLTGQKKVHVVQHTDLHDSVVGLLHILLWQGPLDTMVSFTEADIRQALNVAPEQLFLADLIVHVAQRVRRSRVSALGLIMPLPELIPLIIEYIDCSHFLCAFSKKPEPLVTPRL